MIALSQNVFHFNINHPGIGYLLSCPKNVDIVFHLGKKVTKGKGESTGVDLPSKDELRKTITAILKKVDFNTVSIF